MGTLRYRRGVNLNPSIAESEIRALLTRLVSGQKQALGDNLLGSYVCGSVVMGAFERGVSDVDTVAVLRGDLKEKEVTALDGLHHNLVRDSPQWDDRIEVVYLSADALQTFRTASSAAARISPGEAFHLITIDHRWLIDWYQLREEGVALLGPPAVSLVPPISREEYREAVREHMLAWPEWVGGLATRGNQAYAILTMCRGLRTWRTGDHVSKREAALWACDVLPEHAQQIRDALIWREQSRVEPRVDAAATRDAARGFVKDVERLVQVAG